MAVWRSDLSFKQMDVGSNLAWFGFTYHCYQNYYNPNKT